MDTETGRQVTDGVDENAGRPPRRRVGRVVAAAALAGAVGFAGGRVTVGEETPAAARLVRADAILEDEGSLAEVISGATDSIVSVETTAYAGPFGGSVSGSGSGVVIRRDGIVLTNAHVVQGATGITVTSSDGERTYDATVLGSDPAHDVAILHVDADDLTPMPVGSSEDLELGDTVVALGYPLGLGTTATQGIVSGLDRAIHVGDGAFGAGELNGLLQTDAAINPGNSGGALIDAGGRLVGINTAAASAASAENVGFAVAIDEVLPIVEDLLESA